MWIVQSLEIIGAEGDGHSGRWRLTATSDEDGGGPFGDESHDHGSAAECLECERCDAYTSRITGFMSRKQRAEAQEKQDRAEYERLKAKFEPV